MLCSVVCYGGVWPPVWWGMLRWCAAPLMVRRVLVVYGPRHGEVVLRCVVLCCVALRCGVLCRVVSRCVVCGGGVWLPSWWGVLRWCVASLMVGPAALGCGVLRCMAPCMVGRAALVCGPPHIGACRVGVWPPTWWGCVASCCAFLLGAFSR